MRNWFGMDSHPSDELIHWSEVVHDEGRKRKAFEEKVKKLRAAWDLIHSDKKIAAAFEILHEQTLNKASSEQGELEAGESL